ncbi:MAG: hypothetical protein AAGI66_00375 [Cyanobacteria bacterium P01_H01_bin.74]
MLQRNCPDYKQIKLYALPIADSNGILAMSFDEACLNWVRAQCEPMFLYRVYTWQEPTLSIGVNQSRQSVFRFMTGNKKADPSASSLLSCHINNTSNISPRRIISRPTGGQAVLHGNDISIAVITNCSALVNTSVKETYCLLSSFIVDAINAAIGSAELQVQSVIESKKNQKNLNALNNAFRCFDTQAIADIVDQAGNKQMGCSQLRRKGGILYHGALFLNFYQNHPKGLSLSTKKLNAAMRNLLSKQFNRAVNILPQPRINEIREVQADLLPKYCVKSRVFQNILLNNC